MSIFQQSWINFCRLTFKWLIICIISATLIGTATSWFLISLDWVTGFRESNKWILFFLPLSGFLIGLYYFKKGRDVEKGNNLLIDEFHHPVNVIPLKMTPMIFISSIITHLFGASTGREGVAVQMGGSIADQFSRWFNFQPECRRTLIIIGISAGFAAVFGTPFAALLFALEVLPAGKSWFKNLIPALIASLTAHFISLSWGVQHGHYPIAETPDMDIQSLGLVAASGIIFGLTARLFSKTTHLFTKIFSRLIKYPPLRPLSGGLIFVALVSIFGLSDYTGLGIPTIIDSFQSQQGMEEFMLKLILTSLVIGAGFKGGEVTPLFFIGATLGSALTWIIPLPTSFLAGIGFVAVFAGAANTPLACIVMSLELFGIQSLPFFAIACLIAFIFSGPEGIYQSQKENPLLTITKSWFRKF